jgi:hypothetical protein
MKYPKLLVALFICAIPAWAQTFVTTDQNLLGYVSVDSSQNLLPDSSFSVGNGNSLAYWAVNYNGVTSSGWTAASNVVSFTGTGAAIPANTYIESPIFTVPYSVNNYTLTLSINANLTNQTAGGNVISFSIWSTTGQQMSVGTQYCNSLLTSGVSNTYSATCTVPGNTGTMAAIIELGGATVANAQTITFTQPQLNFGSTAATYQPTVGFNQILAQAAPVLPGGAGGGPVLWSILQSFIPQEVGGTLATSQPSVTLTTSFQQLLNSVASAPTFNFGCSGLTTGPTVGKCEKFPGLPTTVFYTQKGLAEVQCTGVTTQAPITVGLATLSVSSGGVWLGISTDGVSGYSLTPSLGTGTYLFPLETIVDADPINSDFGMFDIQMKVGSGLAPSGACKAVAASLDVRIVPTGSTVAGSPAFQTYGDRSHLVH